MSRPVTGSGLKLSQKLLRYTFDDFVVGESNRLAYAAAKDICASGGFVDTLFLNSDAGLGKTHIVQSVAASVNAARMDRERSSAFFILTVKELRIRMCWCSSRGP